jgi:hypothetical protein
MGVLNLFKKKAGPAETPKRRAWLPWEGSSTPRRRNPGSKAKLVAKMQHAMKMGKQRRNAATTKGSKAIRRANQAAKSKAS